MIGVGRTIVPLCRNAGRRDNSNELPSRCGPNAEGKSNDGRWLPRVEADKPGDAVRSVKRDAKDRGNVAESGDEFGPVLRRLLRSNMSVRGSK
jgi:hypothetical protein